MKSFSQIHEEITNSVASGGIAGYDVPLGKPTRRTLFASIDVFDVANDTFNKCKQGKVKYKHWKSYVGEEVVGKEIREFARKNPKKSIILRCEQTGQMLFVKGRLRK